MLIIGCAFHTRYRHLDMTNLQSVAATSGCPRFRCWEPGSWGGLSSRPQLHHPTDGTLTDIPTQNSFERYTNKYY
jgi:hypothetical protein